MTKLWATPTFTAWEDWDATSKRGREEVDRGQNENCDTVMSWNPREEIKEWGMSPVLNLLLTKTLLSIGQTLKTKKWGGGLRSGSLLKSSAPQIFPTLQGPPSCILKAPKP